MPKCRCILRAMHMCVAVCDAQTLRMSIKVTIHPWQKGTTFDRCTHTATGTDYRVASTTCSKGNRNTTCPKGPLWYLSECGCLTPQSLMPMKSRTRGNKYTRPSTLEGSKSHGALRAVRSEQRGRARRAWQQQRGRRIAGQGQARGAAGGRAFVD